MQDSQVRLTDGRHLAFTDIGVPGGRSVLFFFHGAPMSRLHLTYLEPQALDAGLRIVSPDRPGYGRSTAQPGRSMALWPADVAALADALGIDRFVVVGHSSGGPYAVACAALLPDRVLGGIVLGGVTDMAWPGAWEGYIESERELMRLGDEPRAIAWCAERFGADGGRFGETSDFEFGEPDNALFADEQAGAAIQSAVAEAFRQGVIGYAQDVIVQGRPWPFDPRTIAAPVHIVHGALDRAIPMAHSRHTAELVPGSTLHVLPGHGHMTTVSELARMVAKLPRMRS